MPRTSTLLLTDAQALIELASENPPGNEAEAARYVAQRLTSLGADVELQEVAPGRLNAVGTLRFGPGPTLLFNSHLDVVPADRPAQFRPEIRNGRLYGRGACDAKGAVAAMLAACARLVRGERPTSGTLILAAVADEEAEGSGSRYLVAAGGTRANAAVIGEPTDNRVNLGCRGSYRAKVRFAGAAAHSSDPSRGDNAIYHAARFALVAEAWHRDLAQRSVPSVVSATVIAGGSKVNIIPEWCDVQIDRRLAPGESVRDGERELEERLRQLAAQDPSARWSIDLVDTPKPSSVLDAAHPFAQLALGVTGQANGDFFRGGTDMPYLADAGIACVILGPGSLDQAHTADEWVTLEQLEEAALLYERLARAYLSS